MHDPSRVALLPMARSLHSSPYRRPSTKKRTVLVHVAMRGFWRLGTYQHGTLGYTSLVTKLPQPERAGQFLQLHQDRKIFLLPNAWDVASARIFEEAGFPAIATSSAGIANALGYPDGQLVPRVEMLEVVHRIAGAVSVPVTADMEAGYGTTPEAVARTAQDTISAGAVGMNLEDSVPAAPDTLVDTPKQKEIIRAVIEAAERMRVPFVLNARTDVFLHSVGPAETRLARALERLNAYRDAGAQCLFAPGVRDEETIAQLARGLSGPLNILATAGTPPMSALGQLGVVRVSLGSATSYADANRLFR
jgi:2-methylisocitrate lyase-like PEP mutase family enzyme